VLHTYLLGGFDSVTTAFVLRGICLLLCKNCCSKKQLFSSPLKHSENKFCHSLQRIKRQRGPNAVNAAIGYAAQSSGRSAGRGSQSPTPQTRWLFVGVDDEPLSVAAVCVNNAHVRSRAET
jgi:hypothetical protein